MCQINTNNEMYFNYRGSRYEVPSSKGLIRNITDPVPLDPHSGFQNWEPKLRRSFCLFFGRDPYHFPNFVTLCL
jgi:hypothetical protein